MGLTKKNINKTWNASRNCYRISINFIINQIYKLIQIPLILNYRNNSETFIGTNNAKVLEQVK